MKYYSKEASYAESFPQAVELVKSLAKKGDTVITMGAGNVDEVADMLIDSK